MKVQSKPVKADAWLIDNLLKKWKNNPGLLPEKVHARMLEGKLTLNEDKSGLKIYTDGGNLVDGPPHFYLIRKNGSWYPCPPDQFKVLFDVI